MSRFEEGVPADPTQNMSEEDAKKWKEMNEEHRDNFKKAMGELNKLADPMAELEGLVAEGCPDNLDEGECKEWEDNTDKYKNVVKDKHKEAGCNCGRGGCDHCALAKLAAEDDSITLSKANYKTVADLLEPFNEPGSWGHVVTHAFSGKPMEAKHVDKVVKEINGYLSSWATQAKANGWDASDKKNLTKAKGILEAAGKSGKTAGPNPLDPTSSWDEGTIDWQDDPRDHDSEGSMIPGLQDRKADTLMSELGVLAEGCPDNLDEGECKEWESNTDKYKDVVKDQHKAATWEEGEVDEDDPRDHPGEGSLIPGLQERLGSKRKMASSYVIDTNHRGEPHVDSVLDPILFCMILSKIMGMKVKPANPDLSLLDTGSRSGKAVSIGGILTSYAKALEIAVSEHPDDFAPLAGKNVYRVHVSVGSIYEQGMKSAGFSYASDEAYYAFVGNKTPFNRDTIEEITDLEIPFKDDEGEEHEADRMITVRDVQYSGIMSRGEEMKGLQREVIVRVVFPRGALKAVDKAIKALGKKQGFVVSYLTTYRKPQAVQGPAPKQPAGKKFPFRGASDPMAELEGLVAEGCPDNLDEGECKEWESNTDKYKDVVKDKHKTAMFEEGEWGETLVYGNKERHGSFFLTTFAFGSKGPLDDKWFLSHLTDAVPDATSGLIKPRLHESGEGTLTVWWGYDTEEAEDRLGDVWYIEELMDVAFIKVGRAMGLSKAKKLNHAADVDKFVQTHMPKVAAGDLEASWGSTLKQAGKKPDAKAKAEAKKIFDKMWNDIDEDDEASGAAFDDLEEAKDSFKAGDLSIEDLRAMAKDGKKAALAPSGLYGYTRSVQSSCESSIRKMSRAAAQIAKAAYQKDENTAPFLAAHAKRANSLPAKILVAALKGLGPKVATSIRLAELRIASEPDHPVDKTAARKYGLYGFNAKTAKLGLHACTSLRENAGTTASELHGRKAAAHNLITGFLKEHSKQGKCLYAKMLYSSYPGPESKTASAEENGITWEAK